MKSTFTSLLALAATATALPSQNAKRAACSSAVSLDASTNVWTSYALHPNSFYRAEVEAAAANMTDSSLASKALEVADDERRANLQHRKLGVTFLFHVAGVEEAARLEGPFPPRVVLLAGGCVVVGGGLAVCVVVVGGG